MKLAIRLIQAVVLTGVYGASVAFWYFVILAVRESSPAGAVVLAVIIVASAVIVFSSLKEGADTDETKAGQ